MAQVALEVPIFAYYAYFFFKHHLALRLLPFFFSAPASHLHTMQCTGRETNQYQEYRFCSQFDTNFVIFVS